jgi:hypothetical protein
VIYLTHFLLQFAIGGRHRSETEEDHLRFPFLSQNKKGLPDCGRPLSTVDTSMTGSANYIWKVVAATKIFDLPCLEEDEADFHSIT